MKTAVIFALAVATAFSQSAGQKFQEPMPPGPNPNSQYRLGPDSMPQDGVPQRRDSRAVHAAVATSIRARSTPIGSTCRRSTIPPFRPA